MPAKTRFGAILAAAVVAGASYPFAVVLVGDGALHAVWKGAGVGALAAWAAINARGLDGWLIAGVLGLGAVGDVLLDTIGVEPGAAAFLAGHLLAVWLYLRNARADGPAERAVAGLFVLVPAAAWLLTGSVGVAVYAAGLGAMAAAAWLSRFARPLVALGAALFVASDLLIFAQSGALAGSLLPWLLVWPLYFAGQALIAWGVVPALAEERR